MDEPTTIIARHHKAKLDAVMLTKAASRLSGAIGGHSASDGNAPDSLILTWIDEENELIVAQLSCYGVFVGEVKQEKFFQIVGFCCLYGIPFFTNDDVFALTEKEAPEQSNQTH